MEPTSVGNIKYYLNDEHMKKLLKAETPQVHVVLPQAYYLGVYEVTQLEYRKITGKNPSYSGPNGGGRNFVAGKDTSKYPVEGLSWNDAVEFCAKLSVKEGFKPFHTRNGQRVVSLKGTGYRLPTEAEWEFACRAGTTTQFWSGDTPEESQRSGYFGTHDPNGTVTPNGSTRPVGEFASNSFGLFDTHGNVQEWCHDYWSSDYYSQLQGLLAIAPQGPPTGTVALAPPGRLPGTDHVNRGGDWWHDPKECRASWRNPNPQDYNSHPIGVRVVLTLAAKGKSSPGQPRERLVRPLQNRNPAGK